MGKQIKGILGTKLGMTQVFNDAGQIVPVTVVQAGPCVVTSVRTPDKDGYSAVQLGFGEIDPRKVTKPVSGLFEKAGLTPRRYLAELRTDDGSEYTRGQEGTAEMFASGQHVDVTGRSKGKGTAGVMKRHGFKGLGASHGTQRKHRSPGSIGACATPGRVFKGVRMAGRMGGVRTTVQSLAVHAVDAERGGVGHGPQPRSYVQRTPKKMRAAALRGALSDRLSHGRVQVVSGFVDGDVPRTKDAVAVLASAIAPGAKVLVVAHRDDEVTWKSLRNVPSVHVLTEDQLNTYDVLASDHVVFTEQALTAFVTRTRSKEAVK